MKREHVSKTIRSKQSAKQRLLETASTLFFDKGYSEVGIDEIIREAKIAKATFYNHFSSKEVLVETWLQTLHELAIERQLEILASPSTIQEKIGASFDNLELHLVESNFRGCPYSNSCAVTEPDCGRIRTQIEQHKQSIRTFYRAVIAAEITDCDRAGVIADKIFILYSGATTEAQNLRRIWPVSLAKETALGLI